MEFPHSYSSLYAEYLRNTMILHQESTREQLIWINFWMSLAIDQSNWKDTLNCQANGFFCEKYSPWKQVWGESSFELHKFLQFKQWKMSSLYFLSYAFSVEKISFYPKLQTSSCMTLNFFLNFKVQDMSKSVSVCCEQCISDLTWWQVSNVEHWMKSLVIGWRSFKCCN